MQQKLQNKLFEKYPDFFWRKDLTIQESCMAWGITCGDGWYDIIDNVCENIQIHIENHRCNQKRKVEKYVNLRKKNWFYNVFGQWFVKQPDIKPFTFGFTQVKEKLGSLRLYHIGGDDYTDGLIDFAESHSRYICDVCGNLGKLQSCNGWFATRCSKHRPSNASDDRKGISIDFDGVINSYKSGFVSLDEIPDPPVEGSFEFIKAAINSGFTVYIFSVRNGDDAGKRGIYRWFVKNGLDDDYLNQLEFPESKPKAKVYIDDRAWEFNGRFPDLKEVKEFVPWHK